MSRASVRPVSSLERYSSKPALLDKSKSQGDVILNMEEENDKQSAERNSAACNISHHSVNAPLTRKKLKKSTANVNLVDSTSSSDSTVNFKSPKDPYYVNPAFGTLPMVPHPLLAAREDELHAHIPPAISNNKMQKSANEAMRPPTKENSSTYSSAPPSHSDNQPANQQSASNSQTVTTIQPNADDHEFSKLQFNIPAQTNQEFGNPGIANHYLPLLLSRRDSSDTYSSFSDFQVLPKLTPPKNPKKILVVPQQLSTNTSVITQQLSTDEHNYSQLQLPVPELQKPGILKPFGPPLLPRADNSYGNGSDLRELPFPHSFPTYPKRSLIPKLRQADEHDYTQLGLDIPEDVPWNEKYRGRLDSTDIGVNEYEPPSSLPELVSSDNQTNPWLISSSVYPSFSVHPPVSGDPYSRYKYQTLADTQPIMIDPAKQASTRAEVDDNYTIQCTPQPQNAPLDSLQAMQNAQPVYIEFLEDDSITTEQYWMLSFLIFLLCPILSLLALWFTSSLTEARYQRNKMAAIERGKIIRMCLVGSLILGSVSYVLLAFSLFHFLRAK